MVFQLIYTSSADQNLDEDNLRTIAETSSHNNKALDITGVMMVHNGAILQVLEGNEFVVEALYKKISYDLRHKHTQVLIRRHTAKRDFSDWRMGFKYIEDGSEAEAIFKLTQTALDNVITEDSSLEVKTLGQNFARVSAL